MSDRRKIPLSIALACAALFFAGQARASTVESAVTAFVKQMYRGNEIQISFSPLPRQVLGDVRVKTLGFSKVPDASGDGICLVGMEGKNGAPMSVYVPFKVLVRRELFMAKHNIRKGDTVRLSDISVRESYLNSVNVAYPSTLDDIVGKEAKKEIPAGEIITSGLVRSVMAVQKGEMVSITAEKGSLVVQARGTAVERGKLGDVIRVKNQAGREISGKVTGNDAVAVEF